MKSLLQQGLDVQKLQVKANNQSLTDSDVSEINKADLVLVYKADQVKTNVITLDDHRVMSAHTSPEAA